MTVSAAQKQFRQEMIAEFEQSQSLFRDTFTSEAVVKGNQAEFLVNGTAGNEASTRGVDGLIPASTDNNTQVTVTLEEWHSLKRKPRFDIFASQGDQRAALQRNTMTEINRKIDSQCIDALNTGTVNTGGATTASEDLCIKAKTILGNADVPWDDNIFVAITPAFEGYLLKIDSYASMDYVSARPMETAEGAWDDRVKLKKWLGANWFVHPNLPGKGTNAEKCFMWHRSAVGHAMDIGQTDMAVGYHSEQDYSFARCSGFMGASVLQNSGIVVMNHDGSGFAAAS